MVEIIKCDWQLSLTWTPANLGFLFFNRFHFLLSLQLFLNFLPCGAVETLFVFQALAKLPDVRIIVSPHFFGFDLPLDTAAPVIAQNDPGAGSSRACRFFSKLCHAMVMGPSGPLSSPSITGLRYL